MGLCLRQTLQGTLKLEEDERNVRFGKRFVEVVVCDFSGTVSGEIRGDIESWVVRVEHDFQKRGQKEMNTGNQVCEARYKRGAIREQKAEIQIWKVGCSAGASVRGISRFGIETEPHFRKIGPRCILPRL
jgi:hypothetical protein